MQRKTNWGLGRWHCPSPEIFFDFWVWKWWLLVHYGRLPTWRGGMPPLDPPVTKSAGRTDKNDEELRPRKVKPRSWVLDCAPSQQLLSFCSEPGFGGKASELCLNVNCAPELLTLWHCSRHAQRNSCVLTVNSANDSISIKLQGTRKGVVQKDNFVARWTRS